VLTPHSQITWILSSANRITGVFLSFALYGASLLYLLHPIFPAIDSASLIYFAQNMPGWLHGSLKTLFVLPFTFHTWNGIRHLAWDTGYGECEGAKARGEKLDGADGVLM